MLKPAVHALLFSLLCLGLTAHTLSAQAAEPAPQADSPGAANTSEVEEAILDHYAEWEGTRHRLGGTTAAGLDCSSFIQKLFLKHFNIDLPRSSREQMHLGKVVMSTDLRTGDLLFFKAGPTGRHVAVYLGNQRFLHVSTHQGVVFSSLSEPYWSKRFLLARRLLG